MAGSLGRLGGQDAVEAQVRLALEGHAVDWRSRIWEAFLVLSLVISFFFLIWLLLSQVIASMPVWQERGLVDFLSSPTNSNPEKAGVAQGIFGSIVLMIIVSLLALPVGVAAAIYLEEYAPDNVVSRTLNTIIRNLAGVPAVVYGILGLSFFVLAAEPLTGGRTVISGGLTLAVLVLPIAIIVTAEALRAVPASIREAGFSVGATRWEVIRSHVLPWDRGDHHRPARRALHLVADHHLQLVGPAPAGFPSPDRRGHRGAAGDHPAHQRHRHLPQEPIRKEVVARCPKRSRTPHRWRLT